MGSGLPDSLPLYIHYYAGVEQDIKNWGGRKQSGAKVPKIFCSCPPLVQFAPHLSGHMSFLPPPTLPAETEQTIGACGTERPSAEKTTCWH